MKEEHLAAILGGLLIVVGGGWMLFYSVEMSVKTSSIVFPWDRFITSRVAPLRGGPLTHKNAFRMVVTGQLIGLSNEQVDELIIGHSTGDTRLEGFRIFQITSPSTEMPYRLDVLFKNGKVTDASIMYNGT